MTREEAIEKYGNVTLKFSSYYKYAFTFSGVAEDGATIWAAIGGGHDEIYRFELKPDMTITLAEKLDYTGEIKKNGESICSWFEF